MLMMMVLGAAMMADHPSPPSEADFAAARQALNERMIDYPSARFRDVRANEGAVCGFVNGKNRLGAYAGWQRFVFVLLGSDPTLHIDDDAQVDSADDIMLDAFCGEDGLRIESRDFSDRLTPRR